MKPSKEINQARYQPSKRYCTTPKLPIILVTLSHEIFVFLH